MYRQALTHDSQYNKTSTLLDVFVICVFMRYSPTSPRRCSSHPLLLLPASAVSSARLRSLLPTAVEEAGLRVLVGDGVGVALLEVAEGRLHVHVGGRGRVEAGAGTSDRALPVGERRSDSGFGKHFSFTLRHTWRVLETGFKIAWIWYVFSF